MVKYIFPRDGKSNVVVRLDGYPRFTEKRVFGIWHLVIERCQIGRCEIPVGVHLGDRLMPLLESTKFGEVGDHQIEGWVEKNLVTIDVYDR